MNEHNNINVIGECLGDLIAERQEFRPCAPDYYIIVFIVPEETPLPDVHDILPDLVDARRFDVERRDQILISALVLPAACRITRRALEKLGPAGNVGYLEFVNGDDLFF